MQKKYFIKISCLVLAMITIINPSIIWAYEGDSDYSVETYTNPLYADIISDEDLSAQPESRTALPYSNNYFNSLANAREYIVERIADRDSSITFSLPVLYSSGQIMDAVKTHTGNPVGGDYAAWNYRESNLSHKKDNGIYNYTLDMLYDTTASQEMELTVKLNKVMAELDLDGLTDYQKVLTIYEYLCNNVKYDREHVSDISYLPQFTPYEALINGVAVGQGFSALFYRMCLMAGVDVRCVASSNHAWNIVRIGDKYYNADASFDAGKTVYNNFLKGSPAFNVGNYVIDEKYKTAEFQKAHPMSETDYPQSIDWHLDDNGVLTISGPGIMPNTSPWAGDDRIKEVILERVGAVNSGAFTNCQGIVKVTADNKLKSICNNAFEHCTALKSIELSGLVETGWQAFASCTSLESISFPEGTKTIGYKTFDGCTALKNVNIPNSVETIDMYAFYNCTALESIVIPDSVSSLNTNVFRGCTALKSVTLPKGIQSISNTLFYLCQGLERIYIPDSVKSIGDWSFGECIKLKSIVLPSGVEKIGLNAFYDCRVLEKIYIPKSVKEIGKDAFAYCNKLTIYGYEDSSAEIYAMENDMPFIAIKSMPGDIDGDDTVSKSDFYAILNHIKGIDKLTDSQIKAADCYGNDGVVDIRDYCMLYNMIGDLS